MKIGLVHKLVGAIIGGILIGMYLPDGFGRIIVTMSGIFSTFLKFVVPLMILAYVTMGIANLSQGAGRLLLLTVILAYISTLVSGSASYLVSSTLFPHFISGPILDKIAQTAGLGLQPFFKISIPVIIDTLSAVTLAFILGLSLSAMKGKEIGDTLYNWVQDFSHIIDRVLKVAVIPFLPLYICGTFIDMTKSGKTFVIMSVLWKVFLVVITMHLICMFLAFAIASLVGKKNFFFLLKNQIPAYTTALGTQSSAASIPVNLECAKADGISEEIRDFVVPLCANIHMCGSMIAITAAATAVCIMYQLPHNLSIVVPFICVLAVAMIASPGVPGGSIITALPFLYMIFGPEAGDPKGQICALMVALHITQDSFGTACNVSCDNAIGVVINTVYDKWIKKEPVGELAED
jgi:Na+/H+-dicarboxylate symporter